MARTSREQVDNLFPPERACVVLNASEFDAELMEAEQRGYERARAECADDTKRLDWLENSFILMALVKGPAPVDLDKKLDAVFTQTGGIPFRTSIDAAMKGDARRTRSEP